MFAVNCHVWIHVKKFGQKMCKHGVFSGPYFSVFRPEKTAYLDTFHVVTHTALMYVHHLLTVICHLLFVM